MSSKLSKQALDQLIEFLTPRFLRDEERIRVLQLAFLEYQTILNRIIVKGSAAEFTTHLVTSLNSYGELRDGKHALTMLGEIILSDLGTDQKQILLNLLKPLDKSVQVKLQRVSENLKHFQDRAEAIKAFENFWSENGPWILAFDGFPGYGKTTLIEWLYTYKCIPDDIPYAVVHMKGGDNEEEILTYTLADSLQIPHEALIRYRREVSKIIKAHEENRLQITKTLNRIEGSETTQRGTTLHPLFDELNKGKRRNLINAWIDCLGTIVAKRIVLFFDTFEQFQQNTIDSEKETIWFWQALQQAKIFIPGLRVVIGSREKLRTDLGGIVSIESLEKLDKDHTDALLISLGVTESKYRNAVFFKLANGHPAVTRFAADAWKKSRGTLKAEDLPNVASINQAVEWFMEHVIKRLKEPLREAVRYACLLQSFNLETLKVLTSLGEKHWEELTSYSFLSQEGVLGWKIHDLVRLAQISYLQKSDPSHFRYIHTQCFEYLKQNSSFEALYHYLFIENETAFTNWKSQCVQAIREYRYEDADRYFKIVEQVEVPLSIRQQADLLFLRGEYTYNHDIDGAIQYYEEAAQKYEIAGENKGRADALYMCANVQRLNGNFNAAQASCAKSLELYQSINDNIGQANVYHSVGEIFKSLDIRDVSRQMYREASTLYQREGDLQGEAHVLRAIGHLEYGDDNFPVAKQLYSAALELYQRTGDKLRQGHIFVALGNCERIVSNLSEARKLYEEGLKLYQETRSFLGLGNAYAALARLEIETEKIELARNYFNKSIDSYEQGKVWSDCAGTILQLADFELSQGNVAIATDLCIRAESILSEHTVKDKKVQSYWIAVLRLGHTSDQADSTRKLMMEWIEQPNWTSSKTFLEKHAEDLLNDFGHFILKDLVKDLSSVFSGLQDLIKSAIEDAKMKELLGIDFFYTEEQISDLEERVQLFQACRDRGIAGAYLEAGLIFQDSEENSFQDLGDVLIIWTNTKDWTASRQFIERTPRLLQTKGLQYLIALTINNHFNPKFLQHLWLLKDCMDFSIEEAFERRKNEPKLTLELISDIADQLIQWIKQPSVETSKTYLLEGQKILVTEAGQAVLQKLLVDNDFAPIITSHLELLKACREKGVDAAYQNNSGLKLSELLDAWMQTPDWEASQEYLDRYSSSFLSDAALETLEGFIEKNPFNPLNRQYLRLLRDCLTIGVEAAYNKRANQPILFSDAASKIVDVLDKWTDIPTWEETRDYAFANAERFVHDAGYVMLEHMQANNPANKLIGQHLKPLLDSIEYGIDTAFISLKGPKYDVSDILIAWMRTPDWEQSQEYLRGQLAEILTDEAEARLAEIAKASQHNFVVRQYVKLLKSCREIGYRTAYKERLDQPILNQIEYIQLYEKLLLGWMQATDEKAYLHRHADKLLTDAAQVVLEFMKDNFSQHKELFKKYCNLLEACRKRGIDTAYSLVEQFGGQLTEAFSSILDIAEKLDTWVKIHDWSTSREYLEKNADVLLTDAGEAALQTLAKSNNDDPLLEEHLRILRDCRKQGIQPFYSDETQSITFTKKGMLYRESGEHKDAITAFSKALEKDPHNALALSRRGETLNQMERYDEALADLNRVISFKAEYAWALAERGYAYRRLGNLSLAVADLSESLRIRPDYVFALNERGSLYKDLKEYDKAIADLDTAIELHPDNSFALMQRAEVYKLTGEDENAQRDLIRALETSQAYGAFAKKAQELADILVLWIESDTWAASQNYLEEHSEDVLTDEAEAVLNILQQGNTGNQLIPEHAKLLKRCREEGIAQVYGSEHPLAYVKQGNQLYKKKDYDEAVKAYTRALEVEPDYILALGERSEALEELGQYQEAIVDLSRAISLRPEYTWALGERGSLYELTEEFERAIEDFTRAIELKDDYVFALSHRAKIYRRLERYEEALADFNRLIELRPKDASMWAGRADIYKLMGEEEKAKTDQQKAVELSQFEIAKLQGISRKLVEWIQTNEWERSQEVIQEQAEAILSDEGLVALGLLHTANKGNTSIGEHLKLLKACKERGVDVVYSDINIPIRYIKNGIVAREEKLFTKAIDLFTRAIELDSDSAWALSRRGEAYNQIKQYANAIVDLTHALEKNPDDFWTLAERGVAYQYSKQEQKAIADFDSALQLNPKYLYAILGKVRTYRQTNQFNLAFEQLSSALENPEIDKHVIYAERGETFRLKSELAKALEEFSQAIELSMDYHWAWVKRGQVFRTMRQYQNALNDYNYALTLKADDAWTLAERGTVFLETDQLSSAIQDFSQALEHQSDYGWALTQRSRAYLQGSRYEEAIRDLDKAIELNGDDFNLYCQRCEAYLFWLDNYENALRDAIKALELSAENNTWATYLAALCYRKLGFEDKAIGLFESLISLVDARINSGGATDKVWLTYNKALYLLYLEKEDDALNLYEQNYSVYGDLSVKHAISDLEKFLRLYPENDMVKQIIALLR
jgi:tetratricopeptide (TPR) repeat protein